uniref:Calponin-homology (CH) domain-containing protein n=1 Tax=Strongyloides papillosus TaxID=174720 RepID=A0A0N5C269_STREA
MASHLPNDITFTSLDLDRLISLYKDKSIKGKIQGEWEEKILNQLWGVIINCLTREGSKRIPSEFLRLDHHGIKNVFVPPIVEAMNGVKLLKFIQKWYNYNTTNRMHLNDVLPIICLKNINIRQLYAFTKASLRKFSDGEESGKNEKNGESGKNEKLDDFQKFLIMLNLEILKITEEKKRLEEERERQKLINTL